MLQVHHAHLLLSLLPLHVLPPPPLLRPPRCCRRERTARAPSLVRSGCADAYMIRRSGGERGRRRVRRRARGLTDCQAAATPTGKANRGEEQREHGPAQTCSRRGGATGLATAPEITDAARQAGTERGEKPEAEEEPGGRGGGVSRGRAKMD
ncbi:unnamed protein product [Prorocentrum cordatum]|uniref:Uncharacterized protein n=1 Tax=Prorocentrum cordatum TaxID=2364126 RepID=A0ABN9S8I4_9DINO|nr:unnamed protein product [Polarella glacialis]